MCGCLTAIGSILKQNPFVVGSYHHIVHSRSYFVYFSDSCNLVECLTTLREAPSRCYTGVVCAGEVSLIAEQEIFHLTVYICYVAVALLLLCSGLRRDC